MQRSWCNSCWFYLRRHVWNNSARSAIMGPSQFFCMACTASSNRASFHHLICHEFHSSNWSSNSIAKRPMSDVERTNSNKPAKQMGFVRVSWWMLMVILEHVLCCSCLASQSEAYSWLCRPVALQRSSPMAQIRLELLKSIIINPALQKQRLSVSFERSVIVHRQK